MQLRRQGVGGPVGECDDLGARSRPGPLLSHAHRLSHYRRFLCALLSNTREVMRLSLTPFQQNSMVPQRNTLAIRNCIICGSSDVRQSKSRR